MDICSIIRALQKIKPDRIYHLAAYANVRKCFDTPLSVLNNNIMGTANLLEAIRLVCPETIVQMCSTSEVYGNPQTTPITESHPIMPVNPYAVSKLAQESMGYAYHKSWGLKIFTTRMFAYINPRRADLFASAFVHQILRVEKGLQDKVYHGNLESVRTLIDVRDAMESYYVASEFCLPGEAYNIGGLNVIKVGDLLEKLLLAYSLDRNGPSSTYKRIPTMVAPDLLRPVDITLQIPDTTKFTQATGWKPKISLEDSIQFLFSSIRKKHYS